MLEVHSPSHSSAFQVLLPSLLMLAHPLDSRSFVSVSLIHLCILLARDVKNLGEAPASSLVLSVFTSARDTVFIMNDCDSGRE